MAYGLTWMATCIDRGAHKMIGIDLRLDPVVHLLCRPRAYSFEVPF